MESGYVPLKGSRRRNGEGLRVGRLLNIIFKALRNMVRNSSTKYRQLLSVERLSEQGFLFSPLRVTLAA